MQRQLLFHPRDFRLCGPSIWEPVFACHVCCSCCLVVVCMLFARDSSLAHAGFHSSWLTSLAVLGSAVASWLSRLSGWLSEIVAFIEGTQLYTPDGSCQANWGIFLPCGRNVPTGVYLHSGVRQMPKK